MWYRSDRRARTERLVHGPCLMSQRVVASRSVAGMNRKVAQALLGAAVLSAVAGCAYQDPLALPDLGPSARSSQPPYGGRTRTTAPGTTMATARGIARATTLTTTRTTAAAIPAITHPAWSTYRTHDTCPCPAPTRIRMAAATSNRQSTAARMTTGATMTLGPTTSPTTWNARRAPGTTPRGTVPACAVAKTIDTPHREWRHSSLPARLRRRVRACHRHHPVLRRRDRRSRRVVLRPRPTVARA